MMRQRDAPTASRTAISFGARGAAGEEHVGEVKAGDEQDRARHSHEKRCDEGDVLVLFGCGADAEARGRVDLQLALAFGVRRLNRGQTLREKRQASLGHFHGRAGTQPGHEVEGVIFRILEVVHAFVVGESGADAGVHAERQPDVGRDQSADPAKAFRRDADDGERLPIHVERAADELGAAAHFLPIGVARDCHLEVGIGARFLGVIEAAERRFYSHHGEEILRGEEDEAASHAFVAPDARRG